METTDLKEMEMSPRISHWEKGKIAAREGNLASWKEITRSSNNSSDHLTDNGGLVVGGTASLGELLQPHVWKLTPEINSVGQRWGSSTHALP